MEAAWMTEAEQEKFARWKRYGELGMQAALADCGVSDTTIEKLVAQLESAHKTMVEWDMRQIKTALGIPDGACVLYAVLGHSNVPAQFDSLSFRYNTMKYDLGDRTLLRISNMFNVGVAHEDEVFALCVNLASNAHIRKIRIEGVEAFGSPRTCTFLGKALAANTALKDLHLESNSMEGAGATRLIEGFKDNTTLERFGLWRNSVGDEGMKSIADMLRGNVTLKYLSIGGTICTIEGAELLSSALKENTGLQAFGFWGKEGQNLSGTLLSPFTHDGSSAGPKNTTITSLELDAVTFPAREWSAMIRTNKSLTHLTLFMIPFQTSEWAEEILPALEDNQTLIHLDMRECINLDGEAVFNTLMKVVQFSNTRLDRISLAQAGPLQNKEARLNEELRLNREYRRRLRDQPVDKPKSGRLVLCGYEYAGKTSLSRTILRLEQGGTTSSPQRRSLLMKKLLQRYPRLGQFIFGKGVFMEIEERTRGFEILVVGRDPETTRIWDFAGQREYYVLHDYLFPNRGHSCFLYVCSARHAPTFHNHGRREVKDEEKMREEFEYWLRFIASNSWPVQDASGRRRLPHVTFVVTNKDTLNAEELIRCRRYAARILDDFRQSFREVVSLSEAVDFIDGHSPQDVRRTFEDVKVRLVEILDASTEYTVCEGVRRALEGWVKENPSKPLMSLAQFEVLWAPLKLDSPVDSETVLTYLNEAGEVIFFKGLDFMVANPRWFGAGVLGSLINAFSGVSGKNSDCCAGGANGCLNYSSDLHSLSLQMKIWKVDHDHGFVRRTEIEHVLKSSLENLSLEQTFSSEQLILLLIHLEMCFEENPGVAGSRLFIPALFDDISSDQVPGMGSRKLDWKSNRPDGARIQFIGRRLDCEDKALTILTPGFFPRLQVVLRNFVVERNWINWGFRVARNLIGFFVNGMEVLVEYSGDIAYFVDILVKSSKPCEETLRFIENEVVKKIREFCASPQGCQGVQLVEAVIRPTCVRELYLCKERKAHAVLISVLAAAVRENGKTYKHAWSQRIKNVPDDDYAVDLLQGEGSYNKCLVANVGQTDRPESSTSATTRGFHNDGYQNRSSYSRESQLPTHFYPTIDDVGYIEKLEQKSNLARNVTVKFHVMCDGIDGVHDPHKIHDQPGRSLNLNERLPGGHDISLLKYALRVAWAGVQVAANFAKVKVDVLGHNDQVLKMFKTPEMEVTPKMLVHIMEPTRDQEKVPDKEILRLLEDYMQTYSVTNLEWLEWFLKPQDYTRFQRDFKLRKSSSPVTGQVSWLCEEHYEEVYRISL